MAEAIPVVELKLNDRDLKKLPQRLAKKAERAVHQVALRIEREAVLRAPFRTKNLLNSGTTDFRPAGLDSVATVKFTASYALYVHEGTGIFGPKHKRIKPVRAKALMIPLADGSVIFRKSSKGMKGRPFLKQAFEIQGQKLREILFA
ncbi:MAG: HK97 gp10 family phage protein [bacterium]